MSKKRKQLDAFIALTKKIFIKKDKQRQLSLFDETKDDLKQRYEIQLPYYAWKRK